MTDMVVISTGAVRYDQIQQDIDGVPEIDIRIVRSALGSEELLLAFAFTRDMFRRVLSALKKHISEKGTILIETETVEKGKKVKKKLQLKGTELTGAVDVVELWNQLK